MKILLFLFPFVAFSQSVSWAEKELIPTTTLNNTSAAATYAFTSSSGFSLQTSITCAVPCNVTVSVSGSVDGINYTVIPELVKNYTATTTALFNVYMQFFKWMRVDIAETSANNATVRSVLGTKLQL